MKGATANIGFMTTIFVIAILVPKHLQATIITSRGGAIKFLGIDLLLTDMLEFGLEEILTNAAQPRAGNALHVDCLGAHQHDAQDKSMLFKKPPITIRAHGGDTVTS